MTKLRSAWFPLLEVASVSCGPGGGTSPPTEGAIEARIIVDGPGRVIVDTSPHECRDDCRWTGDSSVDTLFGAVPAPGLRVRSVGGHVRRLQAPVQPTLRER